MPKIYNLFISHSWTYGDAYEKFCSLLDSASNFMYRNYSVPKDATEFLVRIPISPREARPGKFSRCRVLSIDDGGD